MKRNRIESWTRLLYKTLFLGVLAVAMAGADEHHGPMGRGGPSEDREAGSGMEVFSPRLLREIGLTESQQKTLRDYHLSAEKQRIQIRSEKALLELDLKNVLDVYPVKEEEARKIGGKIADLEKKLYILKVESWGHFLASLTAEQHKKAVDFQSEMREKRRAWREEMHKGRPDEENK